MSTSRLTSHALPSFQPCAPYKRRAGKMHFHASPFLGILPTCSRQKKNRGGSTSQGFTSTIVLCQSTAKSQNSNSSPPGSREEAIMQARTAILASTGAVLEKPEPQLLLKRKKAAARGVKLSVELPLRGDDADSSAKVASDLLKGLFNNSGICCFDENDSKALSRLLSSKKVEGIQCLGMASNVTSIPAKVGIVVFLSPTGKDVLAVQKIVGAAGGKPFIVVNPSWDDVLLSQKAGSSIHQLLSSFETCYCFQPLSIQVLLSRSDGALFKFVESGKPEDTPWSVYTSKNDKLECVTLLTKRPTNRELENIFYSIMAANSPLTKTASVVRNLFGNKK